MQATPRCSRSVFIQIVPKSSSWPWPGKRHALLTFSDGCPWTVSSWKMGRWNSSPFTQCTQFIHVIVFPTAHNVGAVFNGTRSFGPHVSPKLISFSSSVSLTLSTTKKYIYCLISFWLDYCNSTLASLPITDIQKPQCVQNAAASLTMHCKRFDHISPIVKALHWSPVHKEITKYRSISLYHASMSFNNWVFVIMPFFILSIYCHCILAWNVQRSGVSLLRQMGGGAL